jgi:hypothetical protein
VRAAGKRIRHRGSSASSAPTEAEAIDLLRLAGATATARRIRYGAGAVLLIGLAWLVLRRLRQ